MDEPFARGDLLDGQAREAYLTGDFTEAFEACSEALACHRREFPGERFVCLELRAESGRPKYETLLPSTLGWRDRLSSESEAV